MCVLVFCKKILSETFLHPGIILRDSTVYVLRPSHKELDIYYTFQTDFNFLNILMKFPNIKFQETPSSGSACFIRTDEQPSTT